MTFFTSIWSSNTCESDPTHSTMMEEDLGANGHLNDDDKDRFHMENPIENTITEAEEKLFEANPGLPAVVSISAEGPSSPPPLASRIEIGKVPVKKRRKTVRSFTSCKVFLLKPTGLKRKGQRNVKLFASDVTLYFPEIPIDRDILPQFMKDKLAEVPEDLETVPDG